MHKKMYIFIIVSILLLTGCNANFNVKIEDNMIKQEVLINMTNSETNGKYVVDALSDMVLDVENDSEFLGYFKIVGNKKSNPLNASINYNLNNYDFDYALSFCYDNQNITYNNNILTMSANNFNCFQKYNIINDININVTTGYKVLEHNADSVNGNTYTWNINKNNSNNIKLSLDTTIDEIKQNKEQKQENKKNIMVIVGVTIGSLLLGLVIAMHVMYQKNNRI